MADCCVTPDPRGDFAGWMAAKGGQASFAQAMAQELGIRDYEALLACSEDAQVQQELLAIARERLPFAFYAMLRRLVRSLFPCPPCSTNHAEESSACLEAGKPLSLALLDAIMATLRGLSDELMLSAQRFSELTPGFLPPAPDCPHTEISCIQQLSELGDSPTQPVEVMTNGQLEDNSIDQDDPSVKPEPTESFAVSMVNNSLKHENSHFLTSQASSQSFGSLPSTTWALEQYESQQHWEKTTVTDIVTKTSPQPISCAPQPLCAAPQPLRAAPQPLVSVLQPTTITRSVTHSQRRFTCTACGQAFPSRSHLRIHHRKHTGERPFACADCGKRFSQASNLTVHRRTHTNERPFTCVLCGMGFRLKHHLLGHMRKHPM